MFWALSGILIGVGFGICIAIAIQDDSDSYYPTEIREEKL